MLYRDQQLLEEAYDQVREGMLGNMARAVRQGFGFGTEDDFNEELKPYKPFIDKVVSILSDGTRDISSPYENSGVREGTPFEKVKALSSIRALAVRNAIDRYLATIRHLIKENGLTYPAGTSEKDLKEPTTLLSRGFLAAYNYETMRKKPEKKTQADTWEEYDAQEAREDRAQRASDDDFGRLFTSSNRLAPPSHSRDSERYNR